MIVTEEWIKVNPETGCWDWQRCKQPNGYGVAYTDKHVRRMAHRLTWEQKFGNIPKGKELDHICRNRGCVNPEHLRLVTRAENTQCGLVAKLNPEKVRQVRELHKSGLSERKIAAIVGGVTRWAVRPVIKGVTWRNVDAG